MIDAESYVDMHIDIRDRPTIDHDDVIALNFIRSSPSCVFRRHFRQGLRSHIMEILDPLEPDLLITCTPDGIRMEKNRSQEDG